MTPKTTGNRSDHGPTMASSEHYQAARQLAHALLAVRAVSMWCRTIRAEREILKCVARLERAFEGAYPGMRNPYLEIPT